MGRTSIPASIRGNAASCRRHGSRQVQTLAGVRSQVSFEAAHRTEPCLDPAVIGFDPIVRVLLSVVERARDQLIDHSPQRPGPVGHHLSRFVVVAERRGEEPSRGPDTASGRDIDVDDLAVLVDGSVDVTPPTGDLHVGLIDEPTVADRMAARPGRIREERHEALHPPVHRDVVDLDPTFSEEFLDVARTGGTSALRGR